MQLTGGVPYVPGRVELVVRRVVLGGGVVVARARRRGAGLLPVLHVTHKLPSRLNQIVFTRYI